MAFDKDKPAATTSLRASNPEMLANNSALETALGANHEFSTGGSNTGNHESIVLIEAANLGTGATGLPILGAQTTGGKAELTFTDEDDNDIQITSAGNILSASLDSKDEDDMSSDSATHTATQQSIKAYVDVLAVKAWGNVGSNGVLDDGFNVSTAKASTGTYTITFDVNFTSTDYAITPSRIATAGSAHASNFSQGVCTISTRDSAGSLVDSAFTFIAIGNQ